MRPYTGTKEGVGKGRRPGTQAFAEGVQTGTKGKLWNNGTYQMRNMRGSNLVSVHATGRALDLSFAKSGKHPGSSRTYALRFIEQLIANQDELGLEMIVDYSHTAGLGGGRVWKCDRDAWKDAKRGSIQGGGNSGSQWIHVELSPAAADDPARINSALDNILAGLEENKPEPADTQTDNKPKYPGRPIQYKSTGKAVEAIQTRLGITVDGKFLGETDRAVREFQDQNALKVDGIVGPITWAKLFD